MTIALDRDASPAPSFGRRPNAARIAAEHGVPVLTLGTTGGDALEFEGLGAFTVGELRELREGTLPRYFG